MLTPTTKSLLIILIMIHSHVSLSECVTGYNCWRCSTTNIRTCEWCHSQNDGDILAKGGYTSTSTGCTHNIPFTIDNCWIYWPKGPTERYKEMTVGTTYGSRCWLCLSTVTYLTYVSSTGTEACTDTALSLTGATCAAITGCSTTVCYQGTSSDAVFCAMCSVDYYPSGVTLISPDGATMYRASTCTLGLGSIDNCSLYDIAPDGSVICFECIANYVTDYEQTKCTLPLNTNLYNCAQFQYGTDWACYTCKKEYVFSYQQCVEYSRLIHLVGLFGFVVLGSLF